MSDDRFTASSKGLACSQLRLPLAVEGASTILWDWSSGARMAFTVTFTPDTRSRGVRHVLGWHTGSAWAPKGVPLVMAVPTGADEQAERSPLVVHNALSSGDKGSAEVEGCGEVCLSWNASEPTTSSMLSGFFGVSHAETELKYEVRVDSTTGIRAAREAERAREATAARKRQAKMAELLVQAATLSTAADAALAVAAASRDNLIRMTPMLDEAQAAYAAQQERVETELAKLEAMHMPLESLRREVDEIRVVGEEQQQRASDYEAIRAMHLAEVRKYETGEWEFVGWKGGAEYL